MERRFALIFCRSASVSDQDPRRVVVVLAVDGREDSSYGCSDPVPLT